MVAVLCLLAAAACKEEVKPDAKAPELKNQELQVLSQSLTEFKLRFGGHLECAEACSATRAKFELVVDGKVVSSGEQPVSLSLQANTGADWAMEQTSQYVASADELKAMDSRGGALNSALRGKLFVTQGSRTYEVDFARARDVRVPRLPHVKFQELEAGRFDEGEAGVTFHIGVYNPNPFEIRVTQLKYVVTIAGKPVTDTTAGKAERVSPASTGVFDLETHVDASTHGEAEVKKLIKSKVLPYVITGEMTAELFSETFEFKGDVKLNASK
ncbi:MAG: LEA type 2 family protein [Archangiaceae bacterium]|nr:LEA type 2 family protein [Archangiaceae bacterium]